MDSDGISALPFEQRRADGFANAVGVHADPPALVLKLVDRQLAHQAPERA